MVTGRRNVTMSAILVQLMQLMTLRAIRMRDSKHQRYDTIGPQPTTQDVNVVWDGYCGSMKLTAMIGGPSEAGKLCGCGKQKNWQMKGRNGYKDGTYPTVERSSFLSRFAKLQGHWVLQGVLNGWHDIEDAKVKSIKCRSGGDDSRIIEIWGDSISKKDPEAIAWDRCAELPRATLFKRTAKFYALILPDDYCPKSEDPLLCTNLGCSLKSMRPIPTVELSTLEKSLEFDSDGYTRLYKPKPNGWPAFENLPAVVMSGNQVIELPPYGDSLWTSPENLRPSRVTLQLPPWMQTGWLDQVPGFVFWYRPKELGGPHLEVGSDILKRASKAVRAKKVYAFAHRYEPIAWTWELHKKARDIYTYHAAVLIEWVGAPYTTVVELAWQNGLGGYKAKSNWYHDKKANPTEMFKTMLDKKPTMVRPWHEDRSEIRILDIPVKDRAAFEQYLAEYSKKGKDRRFKDVHGISNEKMSSSILTDRNSEYAIYEALLNYNKNSGGGYSEGSLNCQTLQADLFSWLTGQNTSVFADHLKIPTQLIMKYTKHDDWFAPSRDFT